MPQCIVYMRFSFTFTLMWRVIFAVSWAGQISVEFAQAVLISIALSLAWLGLALLGHVRHWQLHAVRDQCVERAALN